MFQLDDDDAKKDGHPAGVDQQEHLRHQPERWSVLKIEIGESGA